MSTLLLNLVFGEPPPKKALEGNAKHRKFVKKRRLLERKGFLNKKKQPPSKVPKLHSEPSKKGETPRVDGTWKATPLPKKKITAASSSGSEQSLDKKTAVPWLTPAPSQKAGSVVAKVDLLGEFQSALPKIKSHPTHPQKKGSQKNPPPKNGPQNSTQTHSESKYSGASQKIPGKMVAIDCEMVGTGPKGHVSSLARCSIVSYDGDVLYDEYILPPCHIVDYRTRWSGIRKQHMVNATPFKIARSQVRGMRDGGSSEADGAKSKSFFSTGYHSGKAPKDCGGRVGVYGVADKESFSFGMKSGKNLETYKQLV